MKKKFSAALLGAMIVAVSSVAFAQTTSTSLINWGDLSSAVQTDVTSAISSIVPLLGLVVGALVAWRMFKRFVK